MTTRDPAPGALETVRLFVNTVDLENRTEQLSSPEHLRAWLLSQGLLAPDAPVLSDEDLARALQVREALRALLFANHGHPVEQDAVARLNAAAADAGLVLRFGAGGGPQLVAGSDGIDGAIGRLLAIVYTAEAEGTWERMKACKRGLCRWAFYDRSKNYSSKWCTMDVCGNKEKAKAYRARKKRQARL